MGWLEREVARAFGRPGGLFGGAREPRPQQLELAMAVARAFESGGRLVAEAPTGVGKTFAYLVPALLVASLTGRPAWIATGTIGLQDQVMRNDLPAAMAATGVAAKCAPAKGRANHLCIRRLEAAASKAGDPAALAAIASWMDADGRGDLSTAPRPAWGAGVSAGSDESFCGTGCPYEGECMLRRARLAMAGADVVVMNHHLALLSLQAMDAEFAPPPPSCIVFDECHRLEAAASRAFGREASMKGVAAVLAAAAKLDPKCMGAAKRAAKAAAGWFSAVKAGMLRHGFGDGPMTPRPGWPPHPGDALDALGGAVRMMSGPAFPAGRSLTEAMRAVAGFANGRGGGSARWAECAGGDVRVHCEPAFPAGLVKSALPEGVPAAAVSATVADGGGMDGAARRMGLEGAGTLVLGSPFDFSGVRCFAARTLPHPSLPEHLEAAARLLLRRFLPMTDGRAFLLFTSFAAIAACSALMADGLAKLGMTPVVQSPGDPAEALADKFRTSPKAVLFGASSFWMGVDVPGPALSQVVVMKLPFPRPDDPMEEAKAASLGREWFDERALPEALTAFRQGIGRLVRRSGDGGVIVVMDPRVCRKAYGRMFLDALPAEPEIF